MGCMPDDLHRPWRFMRVGNTKWVGFRNGSLDAPIDMHLMQVEKAGSCCDVPHWLASLSGYGGFVTHMPSLTDCATKARTTLSA